MVFYKNGNYNVIFDLKTGTKIRVNDLDNLTPEFAESMDVKICNRCNMGCYFCHEDSSKDGDLGDILNAKFVDTLHPFTEMAIGGGNPLEHPDLDTFLIKLKERKVIPSMTVHQKHFMDNLDFIRRLRDRQLIYGIGVSVFNPTEELIKALKEFPNAVVHIIAGVADKATVEKLAHNNLKILILGYKVFRRGEDLYVKEKEHIETLIGWMKNTLPQMHNEKWFNTISFDNLAIKQLNPKQLMTEEEYNRFYMGDDAQYTYFIDLVKKEFAPSSTSKTRFSLMDDATDMFNVVRMGES